MGFPTHLPELRPASAVISVTKGSALGRGTCRALWVGTAGTLNFTDADGNTVSSFPAQAGLNPVSAASVDSGGTASDIWALY